MLPEIQIRIQGPIIVTLPSWNYHPMQRNGTALEQLVIWYQLEIDVNSSAMLVLYRLLVSLNFSFFGAKQFSRLKTDRTNLQTEWMEETGPC